MRDLKGSPLRDRFKHLRKQRMSRRFFASDLDLCLIEFDPPRVVALLDFKSGSDNITDAEAVLYLTALRQWKVPVFIIRCDNLGSEPKEHCFDVMELTDGQVLPTHSDLKFRMVLKNASWKELDEWERDLRTK